MSRSTRLTITSDFLRGRLRRHKCCLASTGLLRYFLVWNRVSHIAIWTAEGVKVSRGLHVTRQSLSVWQGGCACAVLETRHQGQSAQRAKVEGLPPAGDSMTAQNPYSLRTLHALHIIAFSTVCKHEVMTSTVADCRRLSQPAIHETRWRIPLQQPWEDPSQVSIKPSSLIQLEASISPRAHCNDLVENFALR